MWLVASHQEFEKNLVHPCNLILQGKKKRQSCQRALPVRSGHIQANPSEPRPIRHARDMDVGLLAPAFPIGSSVSTVLSPVPTAAACTRRKTLQTVRQYVCVCVFLSGILLERLAPSYTLRSRWEGCPGLQNPASSEGQRAFLGLPASSREPPPMSIIQSLALCSFNHSGLRPCLFPWGLGCPLLASPTGSSTREPVTAATSKHLTDLPSFR